MNKPDESTMRRLLAALDQPNSSTSVAPPDLRELLVYIGELEAAFTAAHQQLAGFSCFSDDKAALPALISRQYLPDIERATDALHAAMLKSVPGQDRMYSLRVVVGGIVERGIEADREFHQRLKRALANEGDEFAAPGLRSPGS